MVSGPFIKDGIIQPAATMTRELAGSCIFSSGALSLTKGNSKDDGQKSQGDYPFDYYSAVLKCKYPDGTEDGTFVLSGVTIYNSARASKNATKWPCGFSRGSFVSFFEPKMKEAYGAAIFGDRRYSHTPELVWTEAFVYNSSKNFEVSMSITDKKTGKVKKIKFDGIEDMFSRVRSPAVKANITCTIKLRAEITKGQDIKPTSDARAVITLSEVKVTAPANVPEPAVLSGRKAAFSKDDEADQSFFDMIEQMTMGDEDDEDDEEGEAENGKTDDEDDEEED